MSERPDGRCPWCGDHADYIEYHDRVWGRPVADRNELFEKLCLDGQQAGLSWLTILRKQSGYRQAFDGFQAERIARYDETTISQLLSNRDIVRNRKKVEAIIANAQALLALEEKGEDFPTLLWQVVDGRPRINHWRTIGEVPAETDASRTLSKELKQRGFKFVGPTICYAFMQAVGIVNDHLVGCPVREETVRQCKDFSLDLS